MGYMAWTVCMCSSMCTAYLDIPDVYCSGHPKTPVVPDVLYMGFYIEYLQPMFPVIIERFTVFTDAPDVKI